MSPAAKLAGFALLLVATLGIGFGIGAATAPDDPAPSPPATHKSHEP